MLETLINCIISLSLSYFNFYWQIGIIMLTETWIINEGINKWKIYKSSLTWVISKIYKEHFLVELMTRFFFVFWTLVIVSGSNHFLYSNLNNIWQFGGEFASIRRHVCFDLVPEMLILIWTSFRGRKKSSLSAAFYFGLVDVLPVLE